MDRAELERLDRESLVLRAQAAGIKRARVLTRPELVDELVRLDPQIEPTQLKRSRGFFGLARDLLSRVVERGLHLPDAAERFRASLGDPPPQKPRPEATAIPTVTLAEIYAAQGHNDRAIETLKRVLADEPDHGAARALLEKLEATDYVPPEPKLPPEPEVEPAAASDDDDEAETTEYVVVEPVSGERAVDPVAEFASALEAVEELPASDSPATVALPVPSIDDRCVAVPTAYGLYVWWRLSPAALRLAEESFFFVRVVAIVPTWDGPEVRVRDVAADPAKGEITLRDDVPDDAVIRVAVGFMPEGELVPVAHSPALELAAAGITAWALDGVDDAALRDPVVLAAIERAENV